MKNKLYETIALIGLIISLVFGILTIIIIFNDKLNPLLNFTATGIFLGLLIFTVGVLLKD